MESRRDGQKLVEGRMSKWGLICVANGLMTSKIAGESQGERWWLEEMAWGRRRVCQSSRVLVLLPIESRSPRIDRTRQSIKWLGSKPEIDEVAWKLSLGFRISRERRERCELCEVNRLVEQVRFRLEIRKPKNNSLVGWSHKRIMWSHQSNKNLKMSCRIKLGE